MPFVNAVLWCQASMNLGRENVQMRYRDSGKGQLKELDGFLVNKSLTNSLPLHSERVGLFESSNNSSLVVRKIIFQPSKKGINEFHTNQREVRSAIPQDHADGQCGMRII